MSHNIEDIILSKYQVRKSNKEKTKFIQYLKNRLEAKGYDPDKDIKIEEKGNGVLKSRNIMVGDPATAKILLCAHYDTCAVLPLPNFMAPTNPVFFVAFQVLVSLLLLVVAMIPALVYGFFTHDPLGAYWIFLLCMIAMVIHMLFGYKNKHTANDNTSGTRTITRILEGLSQEDRGSVCAVYFDNEEKGLLGSSFFYATHKEKVKNKLMINFDCVGDGREVFFLAKEKAELNSDYQHMLQILEETAGQYDVQFNSGKVKPLMFPSDQMPFAKGVGVCTLRKTPFGKCVGRIHTPWDTRCRAENIEFLADGVTKYIIEME